jgi:cytochrome c-type biogenesis protein CcmH/NrfG
MREVAKMSDSELDAELRQAGIAPDEVAAHVQPPRRDAGGGAREEHPASAARPAKRAPVVWAAVLAAAASMSGLFAWKGQEVVAWWKNELPRHELPREQAPPELTLAQQADKLREEGRAACDRAEWTLCRDKLDKAKELDPSGDNAPWIRIARESAVDALRPDADLEAKPKRHD